MLNFNWIVPRSKMGASVDGIRMEWHGPYNPLWSTFWLPNSVFLVTSEQSSRLALCRAQCSKLIRYYQNMHHSGKISSPPKGSNWLTSKSCWKPKLLKGTTATCLSNMRPGFSTHQLETCLFRGSATPSRTRNIPYPGSNFPPYFCFVGF